jgi:hypothetical protein
VAEPHTPSSTWRHRHPQAQLRRVTGRAAPGARNRRIHRVTLTSAAASGSAEYSAGVIGTLIAPRTRSAVIGVFTAAQHDPDLSVNNCTGSGSATASSSSGTACAGPRSRGNYRPTPTRMCSWIWCTGRSSTASWSTSRYPTWPTYTSCSRSFSDDRSTSCSGVAIGACSPGPGPTVRWRCRGPQRLVRSSRHTWRSCTRSQPGRGSAHESGDG